VCFSIYMLLNSFISKVHSYYKILFFFSYFCVLEKKKLSSNVSSRVSFNVTCSGTSAYSEYHECPVGPGVNYTCQAGLPYTARVACTGEIQHQCVFWDTVNKDYSDVGCISVGVVETGDDSGYIICNCTHLTDFTSQMKDTGKLAAKVVTSAASLSLTDVLKNILVLITLMVENR
jgi:hypothetical protein